MIASFDVGGYTLLDPWFLLFLPPCLLACLWRQWRRRAALPAASLLLLERLPQTLRSRLLPLPLWLKGLAAGLLCVALARPVEREVVPLRSEGVDILLVVDASSSMLTRDMDRAGALRRIDAARQRAGEFAAARAHDRLGLLTFARYAELRSPLTLDHRALQAFVAAIDTVPPDSELDMTAIGTALAKTSQVLGRGEGKSKVAVLISDGENNLGDILPEEGARLCAEAGIRVYTIGLGNGVALPFGGMQPLEFRDLQQIAETTGGRFFTARTDQDLGEVYGVIDQLEKQPLQDPRYRTVDQFELPLLAGLLLAALALLLECSWLRGVP